MGLILLGFGIHLYVLLRRQWARRNGTWETVAELSPAGIRLSRHDLVAWDDVEIRWGQPAPLARERLLIRTPDEVLHIAAAQLDCHRDDLITVIGELAPEGVPFRVAR